MHFEIETSEDFVDIQHGCRSQQPQSKAQRLGGGISDCGYTANVSVGPIWSTPFGTALDGIQISWQSVDLPNVL